MSLGLLALLDLVGPGDGLDVVNVGTDQGLVELLGIAVATSDEHAALGGKVVGVLDGLEVDGDVVLGLDGATLDVLEGGTVVEEHLDLVVDLGLGDLRGRHLDLDGVEGGELSGGTQRELDGVGVVLVILGEVELLVVTVLGGDDVQLVEDGGLVGGDQVVGGLSEGSLGAKSRVDDRTGSLTGAEAREAVLLGGVLVAFLIAASTSAAGMVTVAVSLASLTSEAVMFNTFLLILPSLSEVLVPLCNKRREA